MRDDEGDDRSRRRACAGPAPRRSISPTSPPGSTTDSGKSGSTPWDVAAGSLLIQEAGGLIGDLAGEGDYLHGGQVIAANPKIFAQMVKVLAPFQDVARSRSRQESLRFSSASSPPDPRRAYCCFQAPNPDKGQDLARNLHDNSNVIVYDDAHWQCAPRGGSRCGKHPGLGATDGSTMAARPCAAGAVGRRSPRRRRRETISRIRVMLHPYAAAPGVLPDAALARLQTLAGISLHLAGTTRTGALELDLAQPLDRADGHRAGSPPAGRSQRALGRAGLDPDACLKPQSVRASAATTELGDKLMLRLAGDPAPDWPTLLPRWSAIVGAPLVRRPPGRQRLGAEAAEQGHAGQRSARWPRCCKPIAVVQYADPVRRATAKLMPNDPKYNQQWALSDAVGGINAPAGWDLRHRQRRDASSR